MTSIRRTPHRLVPLAALPFLLAITSCSGGSKHTGNATLLLSSSLWGELSGCHCAHPTGGMAKRKRAYEEIREKTPTALAFDAGDLGLFPNANVPGSWDVTEYMAKSFAETGIQAWTPGERELYHGPDHLKEMIHDIGGAAVSANVRGAHGESLFEEKHIFHAGDLTIGVTGVTARELMFSAKGATGSAEEMIARYRFDDPARSLSPVVSSLRKSCDVVVVLAHLGPPEALELIRSVPGIDVVVVGHTPGGGMDGEHEGTTWVVRTGQRGQLLNRLDLAVEGGKLTTAHLDIQTLGPEMPLDTDMHAKIRLFEDKIQAMREAHAPRPGDRRLPTESRSSEPG